MISRLYWIILVAIIGFGSAVGQRRPVAAGGAGGQKRVAGRTGRREQCCPEKAQARAVKIVQEWSSYVNTGNIQCLINNYIQVGASVTTTGSVNTNLCNVVTADLAAQLAVDVAAHIQGDVLAIKEVKYLPKTGYVEVYFTGLQGVNATQMTMVSEKWLFKPCAGCDYRVAEQINTFFPCL